MTTAAWALLAVTLVIAAVDWWAVVTERRTVEYVCKPGTMVALIAMVLALDPATPTIRTWFVIALVCSLAGDVFLMLPKDLFVPGLVSFLLGHIAYVAGLLTGHESLPLTGLGIVFVALAVLFILPRLLPAVKEAEPALVPPVVVYMVVISSMVIAAWGTAVALAIIGACLFYASDATLAWNRFIEERPNGRLAVMTTYHLGQIGLALALVSL